MHTPTSYDPLAAKYTLDCAVTTHSGCATETLFVYGTHENLSYFHMKVSSLVTLFENFPECYFETKSEGETLSFAGD